MRFFRFCPHCAHELEERVEQPGGYVRPTCPACGFVHYRNPKPCVGVLVVQDGKVLLALRKREPFKGYWDIPGGFMEAGEDPWGTAEREMAEETGLKVRPVRLLGIYPDVYGEGGDHTMNIFYVAEIVAGEARPDDDVEALAWFGKDELPGEIAFNCCRQALAAWQQCR